METIRDMRVRLKSINSTKQITESMRLISTSKVQKIKARMEANRPYFEKSLKIIGDIMDDMQFQYQFMGHAYIAGNRHGNDINDINNINEINSGGGSGGKSLIIVITGDRGLCGSYNVNAEKEAHALMRKLGDSQIITIGAKGRDYFRRRQKNILKSFKGMSENPFYEDAQDIGATAIKMYDDKTVDEVHLVYTEYNSMLSQTPKSVRLLPLDKPDKLRKADKANETEKPEKTEKPDKSGGSDYTAVSAAAAKSYMSYESDMGKYFINAVTAYVSAVIFGCMLESAVCEQCARITGMDSAVKNSDKIIDSLELQYNQLRQSMITQEIAEIVGGANTFG